ncbi:FAD-dependent oxidoreductase [Jeotgalibacillus soli]|uniref:Rieske domain-containing protein n=1 Tax=Jeotgalibacillus soli TaxID=889306 RepID=A0A0C2VL38_9BACL|nr:FAD-dependent oxidoreductase [Jeotgalibacillus soli]KIL49607.1 hypothetical protein KP78_10750 [Jeotgalibacillus soli]
MNDQNEQKSYWLSADSEPEYPPLEESHETDVVIVGGGITGITAAYILCKQGVRVTVVDASQTLSGTTGHTTAKITAQHGVIYDELIQHFGAERARHFYEYNQQAVDWIRTTIQEEQWDCDFETQDAWIYAESDASVPQLENEIKAYEQLKIPYRIEKSLPFSIQSEGSLVMENQGQFHPVKYLKAMMGRITAMGGKIHENTKAIDIHEGTNIQVTLEKGHVLTCQHVIVASHFPFYDGLGLYFAKMKPERSYLIAGPWQGNNTGGMYISIGQPVRSIRFFTMNGTKGILVGGEQHATGQGKPMHLHFEALREFAKENLSAAADFTYQWSAQDYTTLDKLPYIGSITNRHSRILVATGYRKWGMSQGTMAAQILSNRIIGKSEHKSSLFDPSRFHPDPAIKKAISINADVAKHLVKGKLEMPSINLEDLPSGEGAHVSWNGQTIGAYRDDKGKICAVDITCTHLGCSVNWNKAEKSWDCPCHGSRFTVEGEILEGPAMKPLAVIQTEPADQ